MPFDGELGAWSVTAFLQTQSSLALLPVAVVTDYCLLFIGYWLLLDLFQEELGRYEAHLNCPEWLVLNSRSKQSHSSEWDKCSRQQVSTTGWHAINTLCNTWIIELQHGHVCTSFDAAAQAWNFRTFHAWSILTTQLCGFQLPEQKLIQAAAQDCVCLDM